MDNKTNPWLAFLQQQGANLQQKSISDFGNAAAELESTVADTVMVPLTHMALLRVSGGDSADFLQGQTSNDVREVNDGHHQLSSYCTPKGRMLALFDLFKRGEDFYLLLPAELVEAFQKRLSMFILRSDVTITDVTEELTCFALEGAKAEALLKQQGHTIPQSAGDCTTEMGITLLRHSGPTPRFSCIAPPEGLIALWQALQGDTKAAGKPVWELLEIQAGIPTVVQQTVEAFVPQMANLQLVGGVSFKKGCYPGQEVVARMQYLGKLKRRMYRAHAEVEPPPAPGSELFSPDSVSGQGAGKVVRSAPSPQGGCELLVVAEIGSAEQHTLHLGDVSGATLNIVGLPYNFEQSEP